MKRKEHPNTEESSYKKVYNPTMQLELDSWSVICEYVDCKTLVNLFCLSKEIQMKLIETFTSLVSKRIEDFKKTKFLGISSYCTVDPMLMLLVYAENTFRQFHFLRNYGVSPYDCSNYLLSTQKKNGGLNIKNTSKGVYFVGLPKISLLQLADLCGCDGMFSMRQNYMEYLLFQLRDQIILIENVQLNEHFNRKMDILTSIYNYKIGDPYPTKYCERRGVFDQSFLSGKTDFFECVKKDISGIFVVNGLDYGLFVLDFYSDTRNSRGEVLRGIVDWTKPTLAYAKSPFPFFTLILFTIVGLYSFYFSNSKTSKNSMKTPKEEQNMLTYQRFCDAITYLIIILKVSDFTPEILKFTFCNISLEHRLAQIKLFQHQIYLREQ